MPFGTRPYTTQDQLPSSRHGRLLLEHSVSTSTDGECSVKTDSCQGVDIAPCVWCCNSVTFLGWTNPLCDQFNLSEFD